MEKTDKQSGEFFTPEGDFVGAMASVRPQVEIDELDEEVAMISKKSPKTLFSKEDIRQ